MALSPNGLLAADFSHLGCGLQLRLGLAHQSDKSRHRGGRNGATLGLLDDLLWVNVYAIDAKFEVQMRTG